ncbi:MAG: hypothetical protein KA797_02180 [Chitinophagales bacterium]|nr:hypothetical protein [Chitinophagales bacterium]
MKFYLTIILFLSISERIFCQEFKTFDINATIVSSPSNIYKLVFTFNADTSIYAISMFHDTSQNNVLIPIEIIFTEDENIKLIDKWIEKPKSKQYNHWAMGTGSFIRQKTTYTQAFTLKKNDDFVKLIEVFYQAVTERNAYPPTTLFFEIRKSKNGLTIKKVIK